MYYAYFRMARQARGVDEKDCYNNMVRYNALDTDEMLGMESLADAEAMSVEDTVISHMMTEKLRSCLSILPESDRELIFRRYWKGQSQAELAAKYGLSQQALSYREKQILSKLKKLLEN